MADSASPALTFSFPLRPPSATPLPQPVSFAPPSLEWLEGTWHVTHSTLPIWESKRNVSITYKPQAQTSPQKIDDVVSYQNLTSDKIKTVIGVDTMSGDTGAWDWRGKGWLMVASSHWEVLGYGDLEGDDQWAVTYFAKTLFTPAGIDVYSRKKEGLKPDVVRLIVEAMAAMEDDKIKKLARKMFEVKKD